jgi:hypothetical protein
MSFQGFFMVLASDDQTEQLLYMCNSGSHARRSAARQTCKLALNIAILTEQRLCNADVTHLYSLGDDLTHSDIVMV